jgi:anti-anti-sigma regulatory factor
MKRRYHLIFDLESYCHVSDAGWRLLLLIRRWLNYSDHDVFLSNPNPDIKNWKRKFRMQKFFQVKEINANGGAK